MTMQPMWLTTLVNVVNLFVVLGIPALLIGFGVLAVLRLARGETSNSLRRRAYDKGGRILVAIVGIVVGLLWLFLSFTTQARAGQSPLLVILPFLLIILAQIGFWVVIIAGAVWLVLWLARRMGMVGPARETPLDLLKARYARGEISKAQFEELKRNLSDP